MVWLFAVALAEQGQQGPIGQTGPPADQLTTILVAVLSAAVTVAGQQGWSAGRKRWGGSSKLERRVEILEAAVRHLGHPIPDSPSGGSSEP